MLIQLIQASILLNENPIRSVNHHLCNRVIIDNAVEQTKPADGAVNLSRNRNFLLNGTVRITHILIYNLFHFFFQFFIGDLCQLKMIRYILFYFKNFLLFFLTRHFATPIYYITLQS